MFFHRFENQQQRRAAGGSYWIELQYCGQPPEAGLKSILSLDSIENWKDDSLYISGDDDTLFWSRYGSILAEGVYQNEQTGPVDLCGINYYSPERALLIAQRTKEQKPLEYQVFLNWLAKAEKGFYVLGL